MNSRAGGKEIRKKLGYLPSELTLWDNWTGVQYIRWLERIHQTPIMDEANRLSERLDYDLKRGLRGLSTGMKRKMGLIAALAHKPPLLILDEPTTGLDPLMQNVFHELMREVRAEGRTVFLSSHNLPEVEAICDRVAIIRGGRIEATETVARLTHVTFRWLTLTMSESISPNGFNTINGVTDVSVEGQTLRMKISGEADVDAVIKQAAAHTVTDLSVVQPTLEEIFLTYYGEKEA
jgi:ABC-2 type transport system ATP-binding protein